MRPAYLLLLLGAFFSLQCAQAYSQSLPTKSTLLSNVRSRNSPVTRESPQGDMPESEDSTTLRNAWGMDLLISSGGFGLGGFYRRQYSETIYGFISFSFSEAKDDREFEFIDPFTLQTFTPGKVNRFLVFPLLVGIQYRLFKDEIVDNFRPYLTAAFGPSMVLSAPYSETEVLGPGATSTRKIDFFKSLGRGRAHYTAGGYMGVGAFFGSERKNLMGVNIRYYFVPLATGIESLENVRKKDFGGFFITINFGTQY